MLEDRLTIDAEISDRSPRLGDVVEVGATVQCKIDLSCRVTARLECVATGRETDVKVVQKVHVFEGDLSEGVRKMEAVLQLPENAPLPYQGKIVQIRWRVVLDVYVWSDLIDREEVVFDLTPRPAELTAELAESTAMVRQSSALDLCDEISEQRFVAGFALTSAPFLSMIAGVALGSVAAIGLLVIVWGLAIPSIIAVVRDSLARRSIGEVEVVVEPQPPRLGDHLTVEVRFELKSGLQFEPVEITVIGREKAIYQGMRANTETFSTIFERKFEVELDPVNIQQKTSVFATFELPRDAPASAHFDNNAIEWFVEVGIHPEGWADFEQTYALRVEPPLPEPSLGANPVAKET